MKHDIDDGWKQEAPYLASLQKENPFSVPEEYFNKLPEMINGARYADKLREAIPMSGFTVPEEYFSELHNRISLETEIISRLQNFPKEEGHQAPDLYFEKLQARILAKTTEALIPVKHEPKIIRLWHNDLIKYASVACFILVTAFGLFLNQQREIGITEIANEQMLYDMNEQDIIDHIQGDNTAVKNSDTTNENLENYILNNFSQSELSPVNN
ncbi:hypothetical protein [Pedobacter cryoconitis]|uniref:Uncharacterized protein n=1 Tax=Pedobacter cryoconitis TaxID=188932 RepID=A0A7X0J3N6_9SPHI|nr:hypothetical protein [Pedobacter cryoconitis]MBB6500534.1 hypothetical protein [Pedobacter cryoconitis]